MHWVLLRVHTGPVKRLELFEPFGRSSRLGGAGAGSNQYAGQGLSLRCVPRALVEWLDAVCPLSTEGGWRARTVSAIRTAHQTNGVDCGVAVLLYAEACGQGSGAEDIEATTSQASFTAHRSLLARYFGGIVTGKD